MNWAQGGGQVSAYGWITLLGLLIGGWLWSRRWKQRPDSFAIFIGAVCGAYLGAKLLFLLAEGWLYVGDEGWIMQWLTGKTIVGALLGGYGGVELTKKLVGHTEPTGDWFAVGVPLSIAMGRIGCLRYGCCLGDPCDPEAWYALTDGQGIDRWPASPAELVFNLLFVVAILPIVLRKAGRGQLFHLYLVRYGLFRFFHEFQRATPEILGPLSGYQLGAIALIVLGGWRGWQRMQENCVSHSGEDQPPGNATG